MTDTTESAAPAQGSLEDLRMPELQALATRLGIAGISKMRKPQLVEAIRERRRANGQRPRTEQPALTTPEPQQPEQKQQPEQRQQPDQKQQQPEQGRRRRNRNQQDDPTDQKPQREQKQQRERSAPAEQSTDGAGEDRVPSLDDIIQFPEPSERPAREEQGRGGSRRQNRQQPQQGGGSDRSGDGPDDDGDDDDRPGRRRRGRDRYRDRKRRQGGGRETSSDDDVEILEDDVLIPVAGILDVLENYAFVRTSGYLPGPSDVYVSLGQVKKAGLRRGDAVTGAVRQPREGENQRQKFNALVRLDSVNGAPVEDALARPDLDELTAVHPDERLRLETGARDLTGRVVDLLTPIGKGQRALLVAPARAGATTTLQQLSSAITTNHPEVHLMVILVDARPEEVTDWQREVAGEVVASTFDRSSADHALVAELALERATRLVELGQDVVVVLDSLTRLARAQNLAAPPSNRMLPGGVDAAALHLPKQVLAAARNIENGGSLTLLATQVTGTGSEMDDVIAAEIAGLATSELHLLGGLAQQLPVASVDVQASYTQHPERLLSPEELTAVRALRRDLADREPRAALDALLTRVQRSGSNAELLLALR